MATQSQIDANRANAQKSTGPQTPEGKAKSARNRFTHGFASNCIFAPWEDAEEFKALLEDLTGHFQPANPPEQILVEKMAQHQWLCLRAFRLQGMSFNQLHRTPGEFSVPKDLGILLRYHSAAERNFHKAHSELVKLQKERKNSEIGFEPQNPAEPASEPAQAPQTSQEAPKQTPSPAGNPQDIPETTEEAVEFLDKVA